MPALYERPRASRNRVRAPSGAFGSRIPNRPG